MPRLLMLLSPPRSFSSLVSTMVGQHPEIYGFPELDLLVRETVGRAIAWERPRGQFLGPPGYLRAWAELVKGAQTEAHVLEAANWLEERSHWTSAAAIAFLLERAGAVTGAAYGLEKTPVLTFLPHALERVRRAFPDALYIHVTRHPVNLRTSLAEFIAHSPRLDAEEKKVRALNAMTVWPLTQRNILDFCATLAPGQYLRVRGEDVLADATGTMRQIAAWLRLRTDEEAVAAMLRPEESPYARLGPANALYGNDPKFIESPAFRPGRPRTGSLDAFFETEAGRLLDAERQAYLRQLANALGYQ